MPRASAVRRMPGRSIALAAAVIAFALAPLALVAGTGHEGVTRVHGWVLVCEQSNDLYRVACENGLPVERYAGPAEAVRHAAGRPVLFLADGYPARRCAVPPEALAALLAAGSRVYIEYGADAPGEPQAGRWMRGAVASDFFGADLPSGSLLMVHGCRFLPYEGVGRPLLVLGRIAGYDRASFGLPAEVHPLLVAEQEGRLLRATTALSSFVRGRYGPQRSWAVIWSRILGTLAGEETGPRLAWSATVRPAYGPDEPLPADAEMQAFRRGAAWFHHSRLLIDGSALPILAPAMSRGQEVVEHLPASVPVGDGALGMLEGFSADVEADGSQPLRCVIRNDCLCESAMALALSGAIAGDARDAAVARRMLDYVCFDSLVQQGIRSDPEHPAYGLMAWGVTSWAWERATYGDDNARAILGLLTASAALQDDRWDRSVLRALLADLRTTGALGYRGARIDMPELEENGWRAYRDRAIVHPSPHYEGYLWACYLRAYRLTGHGEFLEKARAGLSHLMTGYPEGMGTVYGTSLEQARLLLPLAWLVRADDTPEHREWLHRVARDLLASQVACGAIRETLGFPGRPQRYAVASNEAFGTAETSVLQENGDPACDLLYTVNFALAGLHEAYGATGEPWLREAEDRLTEFVCRVQMRSDAHPELDGAWCRGFDFDKWEYWGSSADAGWGVWSVESGWTQGWLVTVLGLRHLERTLWDVTGHADRAGLLAEELPAFETGGGPYAPTPAPVESLARGAGYEASPPPDPRYPDGGGSLTDGQSWNVGAWRRWCGWYGQRFTVTVDLGEARDIREAGLRVLTHTDMGIYPPARVSVRTSLGGEEWSPATVMEAPEVLPGERRVSARELLVAAPAKARFVRVEITPLPAIPAWHASGGQQGWVLCDEVLVR